MEDTKAAEEQKQESNTSGTEENTAEQKASDAEKADYTAAKEEKSIAEAENTELREIKTNAVPVAVAEIEDDENALMVLKETRDLMKIQVKQGKVRTISNVAIAAILVIGVVFGIVQLGKGMEYLGQGMQLAGHAVDQLDVAMGTVASIEKLVDEISDTVEAMDFNALNNTLGNVSEITDDIVKATNDITSVTGDISKATSDIAGTTDALKEFADNLANFRLFGR